MTRWTKNRHGDRRAVLGHGLVLEVWYEGTERLPAGEPAYNVSVFGQRLVSRSDDVAEGKRRAEIVARSWMHEVLLRVGGVID